MGDTDAAGIGHYRHMLRYVEAMEAAFYRAIGVSLEALRSDGYGFPRVQLNVRYLNPVRHEERIAGEVQVRHVGQSSYTLAFRVSGQDSGRPVYEAELTIVSVATGEAPTPVAIPAVLRGPLAAALSSAPASD